jgi:hypothetical protein
MTNPIIKTHNAETGEEIERPMTNEEFVQYKSSQVEYSPSIADEAALLLGGN